VVASTPQVHMDSTWYVKLTNGEEKSIPNVLHIPNYCIEGKQHKVKFPIQVARRANEILESIHSDICGPMQVDTHVIFILSPLLMI